MNIDEQLRDQQYAIDNGFVSPTNWLPGALWLLVYIAFLVFLFF